MSLRKGDMVILTDSHNWVAKGTKGVVVEEAGVFSGPKVSFNGKKAESFPQSKLQKIG